jgi:hypothetical protein
VCVVGIDGGQFAGRVEVVGTAVDESDGHVDIDVAVDVDGCRPVAEWCMLYLARSRYTVMNQ